MVVHVLCENQLPVNARLLQLNSLILSRSGEESRIPAMMSPVLVCTLIHDSQLFHHPLQGRAPCILAALPVKGSFPSSPSPTVIKKPTFSHGSGLSSSLIVSQCWCVSVIPLRS